MSFAKLYGDMAALDGRVVTEGHAKHCAEHGHATYTKDGEESPICPRCGTNVDEENEAISEADAILAELFTQDPEYLEAARQGDLASCLEMDLR
jgi:uncharacterized Zn finger protein (UPF0148 family)